MSLAVRELLACCSCLEAVPGACPYETDRAGKVAARIVPLLQKETWSPVHSLRRLWCQNCSNGLNGSLPEPCPPDC